MSRGRPHPDAVNRYVSEVIGGRTRPLDILLFVPPGLGNVGGTSVLSMVETDEPDEVLTACLVGRKEVWAATVR